MIYEDIKMGNNKPKKIDGRLNTADIGTKPLPSSTLHRLMRQGRGQRFYPSPNTEHGKLMQVELVNQRIDEFSNDKATTLIDYHANKNIGAVYDDKGEAQQQDQSGCHFWVTIMRILSHFQQRRAPKSESLHTISLHYILYYIFFVLYYRWVAIPGHPV